MILLFLYIICFVLGKFQNCSDVRYNAAYTFISRFWSLFLNHPVHYRPISDKENLFKYRIFLLINNLWFWHTSGDIIGYNDTYK